MAKEPSILPRKRVKATKTHDTARVEALFASIGEGLIATDKNGKITRVNNAALAMLGFKRSELLHHRLVDTVIAIRDDASPIPPLDRPIAKAFLTGTSISERTTYVRKDGSLVPIQLTVSPVIYRGKPSGAIEVFRDATMEAQNDKMKSDFISLASHQLRTPLSSIHVYTRMIQDGFAGEVNEQQRVFLDTILLSVQRMNQLITTLLNVTRIEGGSIAVSLTTINLEDVVREITTEAKPTIQEKNMKLSLDIKRNIPLVETDSLLVKEAYANLLSNAIKYTPEGGNLSIVLKTTEKDIIFSVTDTGFGIPLADQRHIFTKFFRSDNIMVQDVSGTGLGLYMTKNISEYLSGDVWFESLENQGTTFYFAIPKRGSIAKKGKFKLSV